VTGQVRPLPEAVDLTAYRVIQESLTNTAKHAAGAAAVIRHGLRAWGAGAGGGGRRPVRGRGCRRASRGNGIIGMRERAATLGAWLSAGRAVAAASGCWPSCLPGRRGAVTAGAAVRVLLADDQALVRAGLRLMVDSAPDLAVVADAGDRPAGGPAGRDGPRRRWS